MNHLVLPFRTTVDGREWRLFTYEYQTMDGTFSGYIYALSMLHASILLQELCESAEIVGEMQDAND